MEFVLAADRPDTIPIIAKWYFDQWGYRTPGVTVDRVRVKLEDFLNRDRIPLMVLAVADDQVIGAAQLKYREMDIYPDREHWLGGVFVLPEYRNKVVATRLIGRVVEIARSLGVETLHLQTERLDGGLYARLGWRVSEQVNYKGLDVLVMGRRISD